ncbi:MULTISPECIES: hypothetical protein [unclassified Mesorhizobium]|uniref:hypothetical protein n=1 Tax=unclassified Mesorhizobium TaxID=325217 RepID=UPI0016782886|nr:MULTISPECIES: hypothetical protein [unclassified Mesorhizobium]
MRPREGAFLADAEPKVLLPNGQRIKIAGPYGNFRDGDTVSFSVVTEYSFYSQPAVRA